MDVQQIMAEHFPENVSIGELCDCGHHKRQHKKPARNPIIKTKQPFPETDYDSTFKAENMPRPRSSKRPPRSPGVRERNPVDMVFKTNQRDEYRNPNVKERTRMIVPEENYEPSSVPMEGLTSYTKEFIQKAIPKELRRLEPRDNYVTTSARFDGQTTNKEHFKQWVPQPSMSFGELPSFTGSILFPAEKKLPDSVTKDSFKGMFTKRPDAIRLAEANIKYEGDMFMDTTHNETYKNITGDHRPTKAEQRSTLAVPSNKKGTFQSQTQNRSDFPGYKNGQPLKTRPIEPAPTTIDLRFDNKRNFLTEQKAIYKGHDAREHPVPKPIRHDADDYVVPAEKFETETCHKRDYQPLDIPRFYVRRASMPETQYVSTNLKFDDRTMFNQFFQNWGARRRVRYGDFHENQYVPAQSKFSGSSVTKSTYVPKELIQTKDFKPENKPLDTEGERIFDTEYRKTYQKPKVKPCRAQIYLAQQELKRERAKAIASH